MREHELAVLDEAAVEVNRGTAAQADPFGDARAGGFVVFANHIVADAVEVVRVDRDA